MCTTFKCKSTHILRFIFFPFISLNQDFDTVVGVCHHIKCLVKVRIIGTSKEKTRFWYICTHNTLHEKGSDQFTNKMLNHWTDRYLFRKLNLTSCVKCFPIKNCHLLYLYRIPLFYSCKNVYESKHNI